MNRRSVLSAAVLGGTAAAAGVLVGRRQQAVVPEQSQTTAAAPMTAQAESGPQVLATRWPQLGGDPVSLNHWQAPLRMINFWATWCPPCLEEIPVLVDLNNRYLDRGLQVIGIAIDDLEPVAEFAERLGINYPVIIAGGDGMSIASKLGNSIGALPYTVILDASGTALYQHRGDISTEQAEAITKKIFSDLRL